VKKIIDLNFKLQKVSHSLMIDDEQKCFNGMKMREYNLGFLDKNSFQNERVDKWG